jgi:hypothetical protein
VFNVMAMQYGAPQREEYNRLTLDGMRLSGVKLRAVRASMLENENILSYIFPMFRFKDRWSGVQREDFIYFFTQPVVAVNGFMVRCDVMPAGFIPSPLPRGDYRFAEVCYDYLDKMRALCEGRGIPLVLIKAPVLFPHWYDEWDLQIAEYAAAHGLLYLNLLDVMDDIGLDFAVDTFNGGAHLNVFGAEKVARYLGNVLQSAYGLPDRRGEAETVVRWNEKIVLYNEMKRVQLEEIEAYGKVITLVY